MKKYNKEIFRKSPKARWSVRVFMPRDGPIEAYAYHHRCNNETKNKGEWSWFVSDCYTGDEPAVCYDCRCPVPDYIQAIVRLYEYER